MQKRNFTLKFFKYIERHAGRKADRQIDIAR